MFVTRFLPADATEHPLVTADRLAEYAEGESDTLGRAEVSQASLPVGPSYVVAWKARALEGEVTDTRFIVYGANHEGYGVPVRLRAPRGRWLVRERCRLHRAFDQLDGRRRLDPGVRRANGRPMEGA